MTHRRRRARRSTDVRDDEAVSRFVERFAADLVEAGMQRMAARVFAALLASDAGALTSAELAEQLQISPAAVSGAMRYLAQVDWSRGSANRAPGASATGVHSDRLVRDADQPRPGAHPLGVHPAGRRADLGPGHPGGQRASETAEFFEFMQHELRTMLERWRAHQAARADVAEEPAEVRRSRQAGEP